MIFANIAAIDINLAKCLLNKGAGCRTDEEKHRIITNTWKYRGHQFESIQRKPEKSSRSHKRDVSSRRTGR